MTTTYQAFTVRRTIGGDVVRADPAGVVGVIRWGALAVSPEVVAGTTVLTQPYGYTGALVTPQVPLTVPWSQAVLVRGGFGFPTTPQDGVTIWYLGTKPTDEDLSQQVLDQPLTEGNWYYYSLFLWISNQWVLGAQMDVLVPKNYGWSTLLFSSIPAFYQRSDDEIAADGRRGPLRAYASVLGYDLDYTQSLADGVLNLYNVDKAPWRLLQYLGGNLGFPYEATLGGNRTRSVLEQLDDLNKLRGTRIGMQRLITAATDYQCDVAQGYNHLQAVDDGDFTGGAGSALVGKSDPMQWGIGHWTNLTDATLLSNIIDPLFSTVNAGQHTTPAIMAKNTNLGPGGILNSPGGSGVLVVNGPGPDTVLSIGSVDSTNDPAHDQNTAILSGVAVAPGDLVEFSANFIRTAWGATSQQPVQARVILVIMWFDGDGNWMSPNSIGPAIPANYDTGTWQRSVVQDFVPDGAAYGIPVVWWHDPTNTTWTGHWTDPTTRPTYGRYVSMATFGPVQTVDEKGGAVPLAPDFYLTLGVSDKLLAGPESYLGPTGG